MVRLISGGHEFQSSDFSVLFLTYLLWSSPYLVSNRLPPSCILPRSYQGFSWPMFKSLRPFCCHWTSFSCFCREALWIFRARIPLVSWTKHGCTSLLIPGHYPPLNITIFGDISTNPGPDTLIQNDLKRRNENLPNILDLHMNTQVITYTRAELLGIRRASRRFACGSVLHDLKLNGLLRFRGCRAADGRYLYVFLIEWVILLAAREPLLAHLFWFLLFLDNVFVLEAT